MISRYYLNVVRKKIIISVYYIDFAYNCMLPLNKYYFL